MAKRIISKKQEVILLLLYIFRFVNRVQLQKFLMHKGDRGINRLLKSLVKEGYISRDYTPRYGILTKPAVYYLTISGRAYIRNTYTYYFPKYLQRIARDSKASKAFRIRCQILADWYLLLFPPLKKASPKLQATNDTEQTLNRKPKKNKKVKTQAILTGIAIVDAMLVQLTTGTKSTKDTIPLNTLEFFTPASFPSSHLVPQLKSDGLILKRTNKGTKAWFLYIIDAYVPRFVLRYTFKHLLETLNDADYEEEEFIFRHFLILCPNHQIIVYMKKFLPTLLDNMYVSNTKFYCATRNQLYKAQEHNNIDIPWITITSENE